MVGAAVWELCGGDVQNTLAGAGGALAGAVLRAHALSASFTCAAIVVFASCATSVAYLKLLFWRDARDRNTSGTALGLAGVLIACLVFSAASVLAIYLLFV